jgi:hypothetical protein
VFPWAASGRSLSLGRDEGITKVLFDETTERIIGCGIVGPNAGDLIAEATLAIELGADAADIGLTIHPHPTLSETVAMAAEVFEGTITDLCAQEEEVAGRRHAPTADHRAGSTPAATPPASPTSTGNRVTLDQRHGWLTGLLPTGVTTLDGQLRKSTANTGNRPTTSAAGYTSPTCGRNEAPFYRLPSGTSP